MMNRNRIAYVDPPSSFLRDLSIPFEVVISEYIDQNYDDLARRYAQARIREHHGSPPTEFLQKIEQDTEKYMDDILPAKILAGIDLDRIGFERFVSQRLNAMMLDKIVDTVMSGDDSDYMEQSQEHAASSLATRVAARYCKYKSY